MRLMLFAYLSEETDFSKRLDGVLSYEQPGKYIVKSTDYHDEYPLPVLSPGQAFVLGYTNETDGIFKASDAKPVIIFDDFTTSFHWVNFDFKVKSSAMKMLQARDGRADTLRYAYHYMRTISYSPTTHARQWISEYSKFRIPCPPLPIQHLIVNTLDRLDDYAGRLDSLLPQEIQATRQRYEWWRDKLLDFKETQGSRSL